MLYEVITEIVFPRCKLVELFFMAFGTDLLVRQQGQLIVFSGFMLVPVAGRTGDPDSGMFAHLKVRDLTSYNFV